MILLDANILVRMCNHDDLDYQRTVDVVFSYRKSEMLVISPQTLYEFWAVATRDPSSNGLGMDVERASRWIGRYTRLFQFVHEPPKLFEIWLTLVGAYKVRGFGLMMHGMWHSCRPWGSHKSSRITASTTYRFLLPCLILPKSNRFICQVGGVSK